MFDTWVCIFIPGYNFFPDMKLITQLIHITNIAVSYTNSKLCSQVQNVIPSYVKPDLIIIAVALKALALN
jgi:hypothetical protein